MPFERHQSPRQSLGLKPIAAGVETEDQLRLLQAEDCDEIQGDYFSRPPLPEPAARKMLLQRHSLPRWRTAGKQKG